MCTKSDANEIREADIYYRYRGRSERIRYPELQRLIVERERRERDAWLDHLSRVARIGVENVGVLDLIDGELSGPGGRLLVSAELLKKVQIVREGQFAERDEHGARTLRIVGDVQVVAPGSLGPVQTIIRPIVIGQKEILRGFLRQERPPAPKEYLKQAGRESSRYMPVYHYACAAGLGLEALHAFAVRESTPRNGLVARIGGETVVPVGSLTSDTPSSIERQRILDWLHAGDMDSLRRANRIRLFETVTHLGLPVPHAGLLGLLSDLMGEFDKLNSQERSLFRKAVVRIDEEMNRPACMQRDVQRPRSGPRGSERNRALATASGVRVDRSPNSLLKRRSTAVQPDWM